jgi:hypothetical protein
MTRVKNEVINVKVVLEFIPLTILPEILIPQLYLHNNFVVLEEICHWLKLMYLFLKHVF